MQDTTIKILDATLKSDSSVAPADARRILKLARGQPAEPVQQNGHAPPRIYSREQAAELLGNKTTRYIDLLTRKGLLQKFVPRGNIRAIGVTGQSLHQFIGGAA